MICCFHDKLSSWCLFWWRDALLQQRRILSSMVCLTSPYFHSTCNLALTWTLEVCTPTPHLSISHTTRNLALTHTQFLWVCMLTLNCTRSN